MHKYAEQAYEAPIGYPVVTLGFGLKSLLTHQLRLRRQSQVETHNSKYFCLLDLALPEEARTLNRRGELGNGQLAVMGPPNNANHATPPTNSTSPNNSNNILAVTSSNANSNVTSASSTKNSRKQQQQQQNIANGKASGAVASSPTSNCDHPLASSTNHAMWKWIIIKVHNQATDRKVFTLEGSDQHHNHQPQLVGDSGEGVSSSCSSLSGQDAPLATATVAETRAGAKRTAPAQLTQITSSASNSNRSKGNDKSSRTGKDSSVYSLNRSTGLSLGNGDVPNALWESTPKSIDWIA
ncbi:hypothetical protein ACTXT7_012282 [Hymenolepis weldensis]